jgi:MFS family permease
MTTPQPTPALSDSTPDKGGGGNGMALLVIASCQLMVVLDITIVNIALPHIQTSLNFSTTTLSWVLNAYTLTFGGLLLLGGRAGDILGRRRVFVAGILLFVVASLLGGLAQNAGQLLAARALQGVGGAIASPTSLALISTTFKEGPERNRAFGVFAAVSAGGGAIGLLAGGMLVEWLDWRWVLFVNVPIGLLIAIAAPRWIKESERHPGHFDLLGALTATLGVAASSTGSSARHRRVGATRSPWRLSGRPWCCSPRSSPSSGARSSRSPRCTCSPTATGRARTASCCVSRRRCSGCSSSSPSSSRTCWTSAPFRRDSPSCRSAP